VILVTDTKGLIYIEGVRERRKLQEHGENYAVMSFIMCTVEQILFRRWIKEHKWGKCGARMKQIKAYKMFGGKPERKRSFET
jgi:hypothetical protein